MKHPLCLLLVLFCFACPAVSAIDTYKWKVPAIYVFGDSSVDVGNNNYLPNTTSKANFPHNGIDFPHSRPTGRFSNGYNVMDFIASHMGFRRSPPPFFSLNASNVHQIMKGLRGVSFASGGSGILDTTGTTNIIMAQQVMYFEALRSKMAGQANSDKWLDARISKSLFLISSGGNDLFALFSSSTLPNNTAVALFLNTVITNYAKHIKTLYGLGARKFAVINVSLVGCVPSVRILNPTGGCVDGVNQAAKALNDAIAALFSKLAVALPGLEYSIGNSYELMASATAKPSSYGFQDVKSACCGAGKLNAEARCTANATYCMTRHRYLFWDRTHPTQAASKMSASVFFEGPAQYVSPITYKQLVESNN